MLSKIRSSAARHLTNIPGWRTNRKIVVIESDDWGSIRMPSKEVYEKLLKAGVRVDRCPYNRYDSLASEEDLSALFEVLTQFRDKNGNHPAITANTVVANPDFEKIQASGYKEYFYEPFTETLKKYPAHQNAFNLWGQGISEGIFHPQFHGREHVNIPLWLSLLQGRSETFRLAFDYGLWGLGPEIINTGRIKIQAAFDARHENEIQLQREIIIDGLELFKKIFGFQSKSFIANNFIWAPNLNEVLSDNGVSTLQGMKYQKLPLLKASRREMIRHFTGEINNHGQVYLIRNCSFEPSQRPKLNSIHSCLNEISNAFFWKKPAIINSHRLNYIGFLSEENRRNNLKAFNTLLSSILTKWPDVEFMTTGELGGLFFENKR